MSGTILSPEGGGPGGGLLDRCIDMPWGPWLLEAKSVCLGLRESLGCGAVKAKDWEVPGKWDGLVTPGWVKPQSKGADLS